MQLADPEGGNEQSSGMDTLMENGEDEVATETEIFHQVSLLNFGSERQLRKYILLRRNFLQKPARPLSSVVERCTCI